MNCHASLTEIFVQSVVNTQSTIVIDNKEKNAATENGEPALLRKNHWERVITMCCHIDYRINVQFGDDVTEL
ncbi:hypothetical protein Aduo_013175 [Ancylostoma duodenale]